tara:strand:- start:895 stop:1134 length:240 start_codon:yes stop_codon:yes gene_type:complete
MTELEELEDIVGSLETIEPFGIEPDFSSLGLEPAEVLGFKTEEELEIALKVLTMDVKHLNFLEIEIKKNFNILECINNK